MVYYPFTDRVTNKKCRELGYKGQTGGSRGKYAERR
jgi:hypothetical protein